LNDSDDVNFKEDKLKNRFKNSVILKYYDAIRMEFEHEQIYHNYLGISGYYKYVPRSYVLKKKIKHFYKLINSLMPILMFLYLVLIHPIRCFVLFLKYFLQSSLHKNERIGSSIYFDASDKKYFSFIDQTEEQYPKTLLFFPSKRDNHEKIPNLKYVSLLNITSPRILIYALIYSIFFVWRLFFSSDRKLILFSYSAFTWFWVYFALERNKPESIWISNHYDRWIVLVSNISGVKVTLVQHGKLFFEDYVNDIRLFPNFSKKINNVNKIYSHNSVSEAFFKKYIDEIDLSFQRLKSKLEIVDWRQEGSKKIKILIIGHQGELSFQMKIVKILIERYSGLIDICYKYHPLQKNRVFVDLIWEYKSKTKIPNADIVISYGSSIDEEILQLLDCKFQYYDFRNRDNINQIISEIDLKINKIRILADDFKGNN